MRDESFTWSVHPEVSSCWVDIDGPTATLAVLPLMALDCFVVTEFFSDPEGGRLNQ